MKYIDFLNQIFKKYPSSHFVICSHSHFLVSDLKPKNSSIISLTKDTNSNSTIGKSKITAKKLPYSTFGWSAEQILIDVFNVQTTRNYVVAEKLGILLDFISDEKNSDLSIKNKFYELELDKLNNLQDTDPLKEVYNTILKEYVLDRAEQ